MTIWFTADTHFDWERIQVNLRKFPSVKEGNRIIRNGIVDNVQYGDTIYILGDFALNSPKWKQSIHIKGVNYYCVLGNHDKVTETTRAFGESQTFAQKLIKINNEFVFLNHYPMFTWDRSHYGSFQLYGHCHAAREEYLDNLLPSRRSMDVGVDNAYRLLGEWRPFRWEEIHAILKDRSGHDDVTFYQKLRGEI